MDFGMMDQFIKGVFIREEKNRFLCTVSINGDDTLCYIPSSCRFENFIDLPGSQVLLKPINNPSSRTKYMVCAVKHKQSFILLNTGYANSTIASNLSSRRFSFLGERKVFRKEYKIGDYKADLFIPDSHSLIEIKSVISTDKSAIFPTVFSERANVQLTKILALIKDGYKAYYFLVALNPYVKDITISNDNPYNSLFKSCLDAGMLCRGYSLRISDQGVLIDSEIKIIL